MCEEKLLGLRADLQVGGAGFPQFFSEFSTIFGIFYNFLEFSAIFWKIFPKIFAIFFDFCDFPTIFPENFSENSRPQFITVQPGSRHYCKFTIKFTPKFTPILIKILQSTKFEAPLSQLLNHFFSSFQVFPLFMLFALRHRVFSTIAPPRQRYQWPSLPLRRRRYVGNTRDYKQDYKSYCKSTYELATGAKAHEKPKKNRTPFSFALSTSPLPHSANFQILISQIVSILVSRPTPPRFPFPLFGKISRYL